MVVLTGRFTVRPERKEEVIQLALSMFDPSRSEVGCISYNFYEDASRENSFLFFEEWKSQEALAEHFQTKHFHEFMQKFSNLIAGTPDIKIYEIAKLKQL